VTTALSSVVAALDINASQEDAAFFAQLPACVQDDVMRWTKVLTRVFLAARPTAACKAIARELQLPGMSDKAIERNYYRLRQGASWRILVNGRKLRGPLRTAGTKSFMSEAVCEAWMAEGLKFQRKYKPAWRSLARRYRRGEKIGDVSWRTVWKHLHPGQSLPSQIPPDMPLPPGWTYENFMKHKPRKVEEVQARIGARAAYKHRYHVHTTRAGMHVGEGFVFDDMWHDMKLNFTGQRSSVRPLELGGADVFSGYKMQPGFRPRRTREDGTRENLTEKDMRFYLAHVLCNVGFYRDGCTLYVEHGTAAVRNRKDHPLRDILSDISGGRIRVEDSGIEGVRQYAQLYRGQGKGNPRLKAGYESLHNLCHNETSNLPAQTGKDRDNMPESLYGRDEINTKLLIASYALTPERAALLRFPVMEWNLGVEAILDAYYNMNRRVEHDLEGWIKLGHVKHQFRLGTGDGWHDHTDLEELSDVQRAAVEAYAALEDNHRVVRKSPWDVWSEGQDGLVRLPQHNIWLICGQDLCLPRSCPASEQIVFEDQQIDPEPMIFETRYRDHEGRELRLAEGREYLWLINPFDTRQLLVGEKHGGYLGTCQRCDVPGKLDNDRLMAEMGRAAHLEKLSAQEHIARNRTEIKKRTEDARHNAAVLNGAPMLPEEHQAVSERRRRVRAVTDKDFQDFAPTAPAAAGEDADYAVSMEELSQL